ncbi:hypothetical protein Tco_1085957, partial [Tanacetum coccineum]
MAFVSSSNNNTSSTNEAVNTAHGVSTASTQVNAVNSTNIDNYKKGLGYKNYNANPPPYIGNFMPLTLDLSFIGLDEFVNKPVVKNSKTMSSKEEHKVVRKNIDAPII